MRTWRAELPGVEVQVFEGDDDELSPWLETGVVDAAILVDPTPPPPAHVVVGRDAFHAVVRTDHPLAGQEHIAMAELLEDPLLVSRGAASRRPAPCAPWRVSPTLRPSMCASSARSSA
ncbi:LysR family transcriptional regulator substrate-binding protein [Streptosporangium sp. NBC_01755]|nr:MULTISPECIES: LysR family transcriptional regulator substrate-binding protein [unclassified Streptosporangium]WSA27956.1 LysR family transcriptional regulator substrate-binding protein [Streptosporangium sp. NBC_01810]WSD00573.1 LysR family transcriptional regulator substrate-binding protein [Streptosporangium sp. NBC_01755]